MSFNTSGTGNKIILATHEPWAHDALAPCVTWSAIRSSDNDSTGLWPPGSLHTLGADGHIEIGFLCGLKFFALNIFCGEYLQLSLHLMLQIW